MTDHTPLELTHALRREKDQATGSKHGLFVFNQGVNLSRLDTKALQPSSRIEAQFIGLTRGQRHRAQFSDNDAVVTDLRSQQGDIAAQTRFQLAFIDDTACRTMARELVPPGHKLCEAETVGSGDEPSDVDRRARRKIEPIGIGEVHLPVGAEATEDLAGASSHDAVEQDTVRRGLSNIDLGLAADIETVPIDGSPGRALVDRHHSLLTADRRRTTHHLFSGRQLRRSGGTSQTDGIIDRQTCDHQTGNTYNGSEPPVLSISVVIVPEC